MFKKESRSRLLSHIGILFSTLIIGLALASSACSSGSSSASSASSTGALPQPSVDCGGSSCIE